MRILGSLSKRDLGDLTTHKKIHTFVLAVPMKIKFITTRKNHVQEGFGLLEATAAALLSFLFIGIGANLVLTANLYKIKAKTNDVMNSLIRADIESIKYQSTKQNDIAKCTGTTADGFASELRGKIGADSSNINRTTIPILGRNYVLIRTANSTITDRNILPISYSFAAQGSSQSEYDLTVQIISNASLQCP